MIARSLSHVTSKCAAVMKAALNITLIPRQWRMGNEAGQDLMHRRFRRIVSPKGRQPMEYESILANVTEVAEGFTKERRNRQARRYLDPADFSELAAAGYLLTGVPAGLGGLWTDLSSSTRQVSELLRTIARGDPSVALVSAMHPAVTSFWYAQPEAPEPYTAPWREQQQFVAQTALDGAWWGTITSEPGSGGDVGRTVTIADRRPDGAYKISGQKHFGSGSGITSYMVTTARPADEEMADWFFIDTRDAAWDGSTGMKLVAEWDGHGMTATQSHAFDFTNYPATRFAWPGNLRVVSGVAGGFVSSIFTAVIVGVVQSAVETARGQLGRRKDVLRPYEQVEWVRIQNEAWLIEQAYEGMLRAVEKKGSGAVLDGLQAKTAISELAESVTTRLCRVIGGGSYHRSSHFGAAFEDVRALGFLRPPWVLAYDSIFERSWQGQ
jgi:alkylation response protein AidB-like acyl-CoA dehydrogenase